MKKRSLRCALLAAMAMVMSPVALYGDDAPSQHEQLMQLLDVDMGFRQENYAEMHRMGNFPDILNGKIEQHATDGFDRSHRIEKILGFMTDNAIILPSGLLATVVYHDAMKFGFPGDILLITEGYENWQRAYPQSPVPIVAKASNMLTVDAEQLRAGLLLPGNQIEESTADPAKLERIRQYLITNKPTGSRDPYWYNLMVEISLFLGTSEDEIKSLVQEGLEKFPGNIGLPVLASNRFASRWGGKTGDLFHFATWAQDLPAMRKRPDLYPRIYAQAMRSQYGLTLYQLVKVDWATMRSGIRALSQFSSTDNHNIGGALACLRGDRRLTRDMISSANFRPNYAIWPDPDAYNICAGWAMQLGPHEVFSEFGSNDGSQDASHP